jgi:hypothetical protein
LFDGSTVCFGKIEPAEREEHDFRALPYRSSSSLVFILLPQATRFTAALAVRRKSPSSFITSWANE